MPICNKKTEVINKISEVVVNKFNSELSNNFVLNNLKRELKEKYNEINSILDAIEQGIVTKSTKERLTKLETEKELIEEKITYYNNVIIDYFQVLILMKNTILNLK